MVETVVFPSLFILIAVAQLLLAGFVFISDRQALSNRLIAILLLLLAFGNFSFAIEEGAFTLSEVAPWLIVRLVVVGLIAPLVWLASASLLRPDWLKHRWVTWPWLAWMVLLLIAVSSDLTGLSSPVFNAPLLYTLPESAAYHGGIMVAAEFSGGLLSLPYSLSRLVFPALAMLVPVLFVALRDRRRSPLTSRLALFVLAALAILLLAQALMPSTAWALALASFALSVGYAYAALRTSPTPLTLSRFAAALSNWPMFYKLMLAVAVIILPAVLLFAVTSTTLLGRSVVEQVGDKLNGLAQSEARLVGNELERQVASLTEVGQEPTTLTAVDNRHTTYFRLPEDIIALDIARKEALWVISPATQALAVSVLNSQASRELVKFTELFPAHTSIYLLDRYGALIAATDRPEHYDLSAEGWYAPAFNSGFGAVYAGPPQYDDALGQFIVEIVVPIFTSTQDTDVDGFLLSRYSLQNVSAELERTAIGQSGGTALYDRDLNWIPTPSAMTEGNPDLNWSLLLGSQQPWGILTFAGVDSIVSWANTGDPYWDFRLVTYTPTDEALAPLAVARGSALVVILLMVVLSVGFAVVVARLITQPLAELAHTAERIQAGETGVQASVHGGDEIGRLAATFNAMTARQGELLGDLERSVSERTQDLEKRVIQLETASEFARQAASIHDVDQLLDQLVGLISQRFGYYHAGIFLLDNERKFAVLRAASSERGHNMIAHGHRLQVGKVGVVGFAAGEASSRVAQDVGADVVYYANPEMPHTRSEAAFPLVVHDQVIGVLDVQSMEANAFSQEDVQVLQTLADQIALAIDNARLLDSSQRTLEELQYYYGEEVSQAWRKRAAARPISYRYDPSGGDYESVAMDPVRTTNILTRDIVFRGQVIGSLDFLRDPGQPPWSEEETALVDEIVEQTALALENARLMEQIRLRSDQIQLLQETTAIAASILDEVQLLGAIAEKLQTGMLLSHASVALFDEGKHVCTLVADAPAAANGEQASYTGTRLPLENNEAFWEAIHTREPVAIYDAQNKDNTKYIADFLAERDGYALLVVPLIVREEVVGLILLESSDPSHRFESEDFTLLEQISAQLATALDVARLFKAEQTARESAARRAEREAKVAEITAKVRASNDPQVILKTAVEELRRALGADRAQVSVQSGSPSPAEEASPDDGNSANTPEVKEG